MLALPCLASPLDWNPSSARPGKSLPSQLGRITLQHQHIARPPQNPRFNSSNSRAQPGILGNTGLIFRIGIGAIGLVAGGAQTWIRQDERCGNSGAYDQSFSCDAPLNFHPATCFARARSGPDFSCLTPISVPSVHHPLPRSLHIVLNVRFCGAQAV
ncbi:hypothetical protein FB45DRAFT_1084376, partial [Roridomyces roridus]